MSSKFTAGPWNIHYAYPLDTPVGTTNPDEYNPVPFQYWNGMIAAGEKIIGETKMQSVAAGWPHVTDVEEARANTLLMASSPKLYMAVLEAIKLLGGYDFLDHRAAEVLTQLRDALATAEGRVIA